MVREGKHKTKYDVELKNKGSDGSDEDYMIGEDEYFLSDDETGGFEEENEFDECVKKKIKKVGGPSGRKSCLRGSGGAVKLRNKARVSCSKKSAGRGRCNKKPRQKANVSYGDSDFDDSYEDDDVEFTPDEVDFMDDDEESPRMKRLKMQEAHTAKGKKRKRTESQKTVDKPTSRRRKSRYQGKESRSKGPVSTENGSSGSRKLDVSSNTSCMKSEYEYTISEEEKEQIREASEFCGRLTTSSRSSSSLKTIKEEETVPWERKRAGAKDKEKMEVGKQVCGICLSEEGKRSIRGILNSCSHYFCFSCILEWSKVESRCPLCKERFTTINRTKQLDGGNHLRDVVIPVPKRDQVYQPSEEELRSYIDPYENVLCTECHLGGDDALILLCDVCDSPAHTYCVGLGRVVPDGNWYCDGCRPTVLPSSSEQALNPTPNWEANNNLTVDSSAVGKISDLNQVDVPETPLSQDTGHSVGHSQDASRSGAFTVHERRRIQQHVHHLLRNYRSRQSERSDGMRPLSGTNLFGSQIREVIAPLQPVPQSRSTSLRDQASTSTDRSLCRPLGTEFSGTAARIDHNLGDQHLCPGNRPSMSTSPEKERVQSMVRSHLKSLSRYVDIDYNTFKCIARTCTHTILAAVGLEHRWNEVFSIQTRLLVCDHFDDIVSEQIYPVGGQCSSCFDWFIRNVVREVMSTRRPLLSRD
ncbi:hypothetical protein ACS0TY_002208 [Phlomoides rotata]